MLFCGEWSGAIKDILPRTGADYEKEFPKQLQREMFLNYIDCSVPWKDDAIMDDHLCSICTQLIIDPTKIGNDKCPHYFCKWCIKQWYVPRSAVRKGNENRQKCPMCRAEILELTSDRSMMVSMRKGIPTTIWQQTMEERVSWYWRKFENDEFERKREEEMNNEQLQNQAGSFGAMNEEERIRMAGYDI